MILAGSLIALGAASASTITDGIAPLVADNLGGPR
jgi:hypothetical protein